MTIDVLDAGGAIRTVEAPNANGQAARAASRPVALSTEDAALVGSLTEAAPASDTASSGLNGRLQRIAQRVTSLIGLLPISLGSKAAAGSFSVAMSTEDAAAIGALTEAAPASDTASSGLNGRMQRVAQRMTSLIALLPASLGAKTGATSLSVVPNSDTKFPVTEADGDNAAIGARADAAWSGTGSSSVIAALKALYVAMIAATPAGTNNIGKVTLQIGGADASQSNTLPVGRGAFATLTATIANAASLSGSTDLGVGYRMVAIQMPAAWTAANLTFQGSLDGTTYYNLFNDAGVEVQVIASASQHIIVQNPAMFLGARYLKVRSGTNATPVAQGASRDVLLVALP